MSPIATEADASVTSALMSARVTILTDRSVPCALETGSGMRPAHA
jgi:hypothetical protein